MINLGVKLFADIKDFTAGINTAISENQKLSGNTTMTYGALKKEWNNARRSLQDLAVQFGKNSKEFKEGEARLKEYGAQLRRVEGIGKTARNAFTNLTTSLSSMAAGYLGVTALATGVVSFFKSAVAGAMADEKAERQLALALGDNRKELAAYLSIKKQMFETTLFSEEDIYAALNLAAGLGRTAEQAKLMIETAAGLANVTGTDLNTNMMQLSATLEGNIGRLGKYDGELKKLTKSELESGEAVVILHKRMVAFASVGLDTAAGAIDRTSKRVEDFKDRLGKALLMFLGFTARVNTAINTTAVGFQNYVNADAKGRKELIEGWEKQRKMYKSNYDAFVAANVYNRQRRDASILYDEMNQLIWQAKEYEAIQKAVTEPIKKQSEAVDKLGDAWLKTTEAFKAYTDSGGFGIPTTGPVSTPETPGGIAPMTPKPGVVSTIPRFQYGPTLAPTAVPVGSGLTKTADLLNQISGSFDAIVAKLPSFAGAWGRAFEAIKNTVSTVVKTISDTNKEGLEKVLTIASSVIESISAIVSASYDTKMMKLNEYYDTERQRIEDSYMTEQQKKKAMDKLDKDTEKKRKELMHKQAKDQKTIAIIQAIIATALAVVMALGSSAPPANFILAAIVGALGIAQIALIAAQPIPALAQGGLAMSPAMAIVGDNPNARFDPEVIAPLSKLGGLLGPTRIEVIGKISGNDIMLANERSSDERLRIRGY
jgi:hypothetical protein